MRQAHQLNLTWNYSDLPLENEKQCADSGARTWYLVLVHFGANDQGRKIVTGTRASEFGERFGGFPFLVYVHAVCFDGICRNYEVPAPGSASCFSHRRQRAGKELVSAARLNVDLSGDDDHLGNEFC